MRLGLGLARVVGATLVVVDVREVSEVLALGHDLFGLILVVPPVRLLPSRIDDEATVLVVAW